MEVHRYSHTAEHNRERQFLVTPIEDLKPARTQLATGIQTRRQKELIIDYNVLLLNSGYYSQRGSDLIIGEVRLKHSASKLINFLKKEYHLE